MTMRQIPVGLRGFTLFGLSVALLGVLGSAPRGWAGPAPIPIEQEATPNASGGSLFTAGPGSYYLSRNIKPSGTKSGVTVTGNNVTIDFRGFSIIGSNNTAGVGINAGSYSQVTIQNGNVIGMGGGGISVGSNSAVHGVHVSGCGGVGIQTGASSVVEDSTVVGSGSEGISATGLIHGNATDGNGGNGITAGTNSSVIGNEASGNSGYGVAMQSGSGYGSNVVNNNTKGAITGGTQIGANVCDGTPCP